MLINKLTNTSLTNVLMYWEHFKTLQKYNSVKSGSDCMTDCVIGWNLFTWNLMQTSCVTFQLYVWCLRPKLLVKELYFQVTEWLTRWSALTKWLDLPTDWTYQLIPSASRTCTLTSLHCTLDAVNLADNITILLLLLIRITLSKLRHWNSRACMLKRIKTPLRFCSVYADIFFVLWAIL